MQQDVSPRRRILLVEDDVDLCEALGETLQEHGHIVAVALDGSDGLQRMREFRPDVVVLDLMMRHVDGWQFRVAQRNDPMLAATPVVVISASNSPSATAVDADLYLRKPLEAKTLVQAIEDVLNTRQRRLEPARMAQAERLAAIGTLAVGLAHEINNPLTYVLLKLQQATRLLPALASDQNRAAVSQIEELVRSALEGADRIRGITGAIRTFTRPDDISMSVVDVRAPLDAAIKLSMNEVRARARLSTEYESPPLVMGNEGRLGQVFLNLLTNAVQAIAEGNVEDNLIRVVARVDSDHVVVEISDTGKGIPPHVLGRVFEPFFSTKPFGEGTGLGLSISHNIVAGMGGEITIASELGTGTTVRVVLLRAGAD
jgi:signal transduction histidine kinase